MRVPANEILHGFLEEMTGQKRGVPWMGVSLLEMRHLNEMELAALINARAGASKMGFIEWDEGEGPEADEPDEFYVDADPGEFQVLPSGAHLKSWDPQYPSGEFAVFAKHSLRGMASGTGVTYNTLANDLEGVNFSSIRQGTLDERENWKELQEWLIECLHRPVFEAWLPRALLLASIKVKNTPLRPERLERYSLVEWQARRWAWIDPSSDATAAEKAKNNMLQAPGQIIRESGRDPDTVWRESASDVRRMIDSYVEQGDTLETAEKLVLQSMGFKEATPQSNNYAKKEEEPKATE
ncbi:Phage portal protein, lambda family [compost metagenome]